MNSGCICCTLVGDFSKALQKVLADYTPDRVIIEPSGVGKLSDVVKAIEGVKDEADIEIDGRITVVDGKKAKIYLKNFGEFFNNQVEHASTIVISRTQMMTDEKVEECVHMLREKNAEATIISTPWEELGKDAVLHALQYGAEIEGILEEHAHEHDDHEHHHHHDDECGCGHHHDHHHHHADEVFTSWGRETIKKFTREGLEKMLESLSASEEYGVILRAKGMLPAEDGTWIYFDMVPEETEIREGSPEYTGRLCVIGSKLNEEKLVKLFGVA